MCCTVRLPTLQAGQQQASLATSLTLMASRAGRQSLQLSYRSRLLADRMMHSLIALLSAGVTCHMSSCGAQSTTLLIALRTSCCTHL